MSDGTTMVVKQFHNKGSMSKVAKKLSKREEVLKTFRIETRKIESTDLKILAGVGLFANSDGSVSIVVNGVEQSELAPLLRTLAEQVGQEGVVENNA